MGCLFKAISLINRSLNSVDKQAQIANQNTSSRRAFMVINSIGSAYPNTGQMTGEVVDAEDLLSEYDTDQDGLASFPSFAVTFL
jgi:hypothetical protein